MNPFIVYVKWSDEGLWWTDIKDGSRLWHLFHYGIIERTLDDGHTYKGLQIIIFWLCIAIGLKPKQERKP